MKDFKKEFEKWFWTEVPLVSIDIFNHSTTPESMKWGVYVDFFDSVGIRLSITFDETDNDFIYEVETDNGNGYEYEYKTTRKEARNAAIKKAIEIFESNE